MEGQTMPDPAKLELVRARLAKWFPTAYLRVRDPGGFRPVAFMLRWSPQREARVRVAWERFESYRTAEEILPADVLAALEAGASVLVLGDGFEVEGAD
jgi:hypothetical protein